MKRIEEAIPEKSFADVSDHLIETANTFFRLNQEILKGRIDFDSWDGTQTVQWLSLRPQSAGHLLTLQEFAGYGPAELSTVSALLAGICQTALQTVADLDTITAIEKDQEVDFCICGRTSLKRFEALLKTHTELKRLLHRM